jgi:hypothetical protein
MLPLLQQLLCQGTVKAVAVLLCDNMLLSRHDAGVGVGGWGWGSREKGLWVCWQLTVETNNKSSGVVGSQAVLSNSQGTAFDAGVPDISRCGLICVSRGI